jgi:ABC-type uncharacterized transport system involved in gliding motility auxiliary subunit
LVKSSTLSAGVLLSVALLGIVNYFGWKYYQRFDWTKDDFYTLSEKSENLMRSLDRDIEAVVFMSPTEQLFDPVRELLARYDGASPRFAVRLVDPEKNLAEAQSLVDRYQLTQLNVVVFDRGDDRRMVEGADLADYDYSGLQFGQGPEMTGFKGEQVFTGAILELVEDRKPAILFTVGHGERSLDEVSAYGLSQAQDILGRDNFDIEAWASLGQSSVPAGTDMIVIAGPTSSFIEPELQVLSEYLREGGRALILLDPPLTGDGLLETRGLEDLLVQFGVEVGEDIVVDPSNPIPFYGAETIFVDSYGSHTVTRSLQQTEIPVIMALARSVRPAAEPKGAYEVAELLRTSSDGWGETNLSNLERVEKDDSDVDGPVSVGVAVTRREKDQDPEEEPADRIDGEEAGQLDEPASPPTRILVFGDSDFATNGQLANVGNAELMINAFNWLVERESLVGIAPKRPEQVRLSLTRSQLRAISGLVFGALPGLAMLLGIAVFFRRRR